MIVNCPSCDTKFRMAGSASGRRVKCGRCAHAWIPAAGPETGAAEPRPATGAAVAGAGIPASRDASPDAPVAAPESVTPVGRRVKRTARKIGQLYRPLPKAPRWRHGHTATEDRPGTGGLGWGLVALSTLAVVAVLWLGRSQLISFWPPAAGLYASAGFDPVNGQPELNRPAPATRSEIALRNILPNRMVEAGVTWLVLEGGVTNIGERLIELPELQAVIRNADGLVVHEWSFTAESAILAPGEATRFTTRVPEPAGQGTSVEVAPMVGG